MNKTGWIFLMLTVVGLAIVVVAVLPSQSIEASSQSSHSFSVDAPMERVRKILVRTNAVKKIVAMADAELMDQQWLQMQFDIQRPLLKRDWKLDGSGRLKVMVNDSYLGAQQMTLNQTIDIEPQRLSAVNRLDAPTESIKDYDSTLTLTPDENGNAKIDSTLKLRIATTAGWLTSGTVKREIEKSASRALENQERAIRQLVQEHKDELIILPESNSE